ncbi:hypothetical protein [Burkholderia pseudomultivorans]|uniref:hypothetical protein n=1 Tax=Burkholderia pseudomultivorans TaxID=1207504 RepID=UPI001E5EB35C|nr:hypothetical protein [Burkholderia pseudomultivorans]
MIAGEFEQDAVRRAQHLAQREAAARHPALVAPRLHALVLARPQFERHRARDALQLLRVARTDARVQELDQHAFALEQQHVLGIDEIERHRFGRDRRSHRTGGEVGARRDGGVLRGARAKPAHEPVGRRTVGAGECAIVVQRVQRLRLFERADHPAEEMIAEP